jgi:hypothetical protein
MGSLAISWIVTKRLVRCSNKNPDKPVNPVYEKALGGVTNVA